jgi:hypothetical protein
VAAADPLRGSLAKPFTPGARSKSDATHPFSIPTHQKSRFCVYRAHLYSSENRITEAKRETKDGVFAADLTVKEL